MFTLWRHRSYRDLWLARSDDAIILNSYSEFITHPNWQEENSHVKDYSLLALPVKNQQDWKQFPQISFMFLFCKVRGSKIFIFLSFLFLKEIMFYVLCHYFFKQQLLCSYLAVFIWNKTIVGPILLLMEKKATRQSRRDAESPSDAVGFLG